MSLLFRVILAVALCAAPLVNAATAGKIVSVHDRAGLLHALATARPPERIELASGAYGELALTQYLRFPVNFAAPLTIASADPTHPAQFTTLKLSAARNVVLQDLLFSYTPKPGDRFYTTPFAIGDCQAITLRDNHFAGTPAHGLSKIADGYGMATGLSIRGSTDVLVRGNDFSRFMIGINVMASSGVRVIGNDIHGMRMDGMELSQVQHVLIARNHIHGFAKAPGSHDHPDMIQFWTAGTHAATRDVTIENNLLNAEGRGWTQSIFMGNELMRHHKTGKEMLYRDIRIRQNVIINAHLHGIMVGAGTGITISHNTLIHDARSNGASQNPPLWRPRIDVDKRSTNVIIDGNITAGIVPSKPEPGWTIAHNVIAQDRRPTAPDFYASIYRNAIKGDPRDLRNFAYLKDGPADGIHVGAAALIAPK